ncbi:hypothetical protein [Afipia felis]
MTFPESDAAIVRASIGERRRQRKAQGLRYPDAAGHVAAPPSDAAA